MQPAHRAIWFLAGICSPCPYGMDVEPGDTQLCTLIGGFTRHHLVPVATTRIPITALDIAIHAVGPRMRNANWRRRRLLSLDAAPYQPPDSPAACPTGFFKPRGEVSTAILPTNLCTSYGHANSLYVAEINTLHTQGPCIGCLAGRSTTGTNSTDRTHCLCLPGHVPNPGGHCTPCPVNSYLPLLGSGAATCLQCPPNETTWQVSAANPKPT